LGSLVNYERSVSFGTELGGHIVSGHIHCTAKIVQIVKLENNYKMQLSLPKKWQKYVLYNEYGQRLCAHPAQYQTTQNARN